MRFVFAHRDHWEAMTNVDFVLAGVVGWGVYSIPTCAHDEEAFPIITMVVCRHFVDAQLMFF